MKPLNISQIQIQEAISKTKSMSAAAAFLKVRYSTFKRYAERYDLWQPNQGGRGTNKPSPKNTIPLNEILAGKHPSYSGTKLKRRIIKAGILDHTICDICNGPNVHNGKELKMQLDHIDGDRYNHKL